jgi:bifunctional DNase/RNase
VTFHKVEIQRVIGPTPNGAAVLVGNDKKTFVIFIGFNEAAALIREINTEAPARPLTHELVQNIFIGFGVSVKNVVISSIIDNTFCATLVLQQDLAEDTEGKEWGGKRNEVRIDSRPSDCLVLALKNKVDILVSDEVFSQVQDVSQMAQEVESNLAGMMGMPGSEGGQGPGGFDSGSVEIPDELPSDIFPDSESATEEPEWGDFTLEDDQDPGDQEQENLGD